MSIDIYNVFHILYSFKHRKLVFPFLFKIYISFRHNFSSRNLLATPPRHLLPFELLPANPGANAQTVRPPHKEAK